ncbi:hypothetical protein LGL08_16145 [Clostridium estertheticum]|uniref:hypothetical protein n=1 Tax=Clostridium estertheticum TaxID=238834 RepID=UPI001CF0F0B6|nr:hypothetical protein [Clostridium estertheticum]MCB2307565.1 hypothetical protein [Clostridium estertheticum]MCB2347181.1 hypothetical protein [Clostridium estertheticum]MCB2351055.1 hypothetical protein [Clostridium estertheticum]WAG46727.1 hypothetical protein LL127_04025 [Clostridium estertheticum]
MIKILTGEYRRIGSVIRYATGPNKGRIVKHLKPVHMEVAQQAQGLVAKAIQFAKNNKKALIIVGISTGITAAGVGIYYKIKNHDPEVVLKFRASLKTYINGIRKGNLSVDSINDLMNCLENLKKHKDYEKISIQLSTEELDILVNRIFEYTEKLAKDNSIVLTEDELNAQISDGTILNLQRYLKAQKKIFETAA